MLWSGSTCSWISETASGGVTTISTSEGSSGAVLARPSPPCTTMSVPLGRSCASLLVMAAVAGVMEQLRLEILPLPTVSCSGDAATGSLEMETAILKGPGVKGVTVAVARRPRCSSVTGSGVVCPMELVATTEMASWPVNMRRVLSTPLACTHRARRCLPRARTREHIAQTHSTYARGRTCSAMVVGAPATRGTEGSTSTISHSAAVMGSYAACTRMGMPATATLSTVAVSSQSPSTSSSRESVYVPSPLSTTPPGCTEPTARAASSTRAPPRVQVLPCLSRATSVSTLRWQHLSARELPRSMTEHCFASGAAASTVMVRGQLGSDSPSTVTCTMYAPALSTATCATSPRSSNAFQPAEMLSRMTDSDLPGARKTCTFCASPMGMVLRSASHSVTCTLTGSPATNAFFLPTNSATHDATLTGAGCTVRLTGPPKRCVPEKE